MYGYSLLRQRPISRHELFGLVLRNRQISFQ